VGGRRADAVNMATRRGRANNTFCRPGRKIHLGGKPAPPRAHAVPPGRSQCLSSPAAFCNSRHIEKKEILFLSRGEEGEVSTIAAPAGCHHAASLLPRHSYTTIAHARYPYHF